MKYKAKDIARELGVSPATVSLVLNNKPGVGPEKRKEIIEKIIELDCEYLLKDGGVSKGDIGFIIYKCGGTVIGEYPVFNYMAESITKMIEKHNYMMNIMFLDKVTPLAERYLALENFKCAGYIVYGVEMYPEDLEIFSKLNAPCVFLDNPFIDSDVDTVTVDNYMGIKQEFDYLYEMGHREIGYIRSKIPIQCFDERFAAYCDLMKKSGLPINPEYIMHVGYLEKNTDKDVEAYLDHCDRLPTVFMADNDLLACRALRIFKNRGIQVPEEVSFVGFDNRTICSFVEPSMTTIQLPAEEMGELAVELLMKKIERNAGATVKYKVGAKLIVNQSVRKLVQGL